MNRAEEFVLSVCERSVLSLWCYGNPKGKGGSELCDILVVCDPDIIIVSVKEITLKTDGDLAVEAAKWQRKAVDASVKQVYGAQRWLTTAGQVIRKDGVPALLLPPAGRRVVHRIAVAIGAGGELMIASGDFGQGYVHVMDETSFLEVLTELDTITDLVDYLKAKEGLTKGGCATVVSGSESNLLGWYLYHGRTFPDRQQLLLVDDSIWEAIKEKPEFGRRKAADRESYVWDRLIEGLLDPAWKPIGEHKEQPVDLEPTLRLMARETRFSRRLLGRSTREFLEQGQQRKLRSRAVPAPSGVLYVLVYFESKDAAAARLAELHDRCILARHTVGAGDTVVGIGISEFVPGAGTALELIHLDLRLWSAAHAVRAEALKSTTGFFREAERRGSYEDEFPRES